MTEHNEQHIQHRKLLYYRLVGSLDNSKQLGKLSVNCPSSTRRLRCVAAAAAALYIGYMYASYAYIVTHGTFLEHQIELT